MRFVRYAAGRKLGEGFGFHRLSDNCRLPFAPPFNLDEMRIVNARFGGQEDNPVIEFLADPHKPDQWVVVQNRRVDYRANDDGSKTTVSAFGFAQYLFPVYGNDTPLIRSQVLTMPAEIQKHGGWVSVADWQRISEHPEIAFDTLDIPVAPVSQSADTGTFTSVDEARFSLWVWKNCWAYIQSNSAEFSTVYVLVTPRSRIQNTLTEGLDFLAGRLNRLLPDIVKSMLTVAIGVPSSSTRTFERSVLQILYDDSLNQSDRCFDFTSDKLTMPAHFSLSQEEEAIASGLEKGHWPDLYQRIADAVDDPKVLGSYALLLLCQRVCSGSEDVDAWFDCLMELRRFLDRMGVSDTVIDRILKENEAQFLQHIQSTNWPDDDAHRIALVVRCIRSSTEDTLWDGFMKALQNGRSPELSLQMLIDGLYKVPDYGSIEQDHLRFFDAFNQLSKTACKQEMPPDIATLQGLYTVLSKYANNPTKNEEAYISFRRHLAELLTASSTKKGYIDETVMNYLEKYRFSSDQLVGIEDVAVGFVLYFDWTGCEAEIAMLERVRKLDAAQVEEKLGNAIDAHVRSSEQKIVSRNELIAYLAFIRSNRIKNQSDNASRLLSSCSEPLLESIITDLRSVIASPRGIYDAGMKHVTCTDSIPAEEYLEWIEVERQLGYHDTALAKHIAQRMGDNHFECSDSQAEIFTEYLRERLGDIDADEAALAWYGSHNSEDTLAKSVLQRMIYAGTPVSYSEETRVGRLYIKCLNNSFEQEFNCCDSWEKISSLPNRCSWATNEAYDKVLAYKRMHPGVLVDSNRDVWLEKMLASEQRGTNPTAQLEAASRFKSLLNSSVNFTPLASDLRKCLSAYVAKKLIPEAFQAALDSADRECSLALYSNLKRYADELSDIRQDTEAHDCIDAAVWVEQLLNASTAEEMARLPCPEASAAQKLRPYAKTLYQMVVESLSADRKRKDGHGAAYLAALHLAALKKVKHADRVDWTLYRTLTGTMDDDAEISLIAFTQRLFESTNLQGTEFYIDFTEYVRTREKNGLQLPLPEKIIHTSSMLAWLNKKERD